GAVDTLILSDALRRYKIKISCPSCGYSGEMVVDDTENIKCPKCSSSAIIEDKKDILEEYSDMADQSSTKVEIISKDTEEGNILMKAFGGIAGILRYRIE
ncbi:MAG TPA: peptide chain release factor 1, partial [Thermoplasmatales archaeon]|nr:peptide chain release factor 1 [Thermoplasmatales archaeon]